MDTHQLYLGSNRESSFPTLGRVPELVLHQDRTIRAREEWPEQVQPPSPLQQTHHCSLTLIRRHDHCGNEHP